MQVVNKHSWKINILRYGDKAFGIHAFCYVSHKATCRPTGNTNKIFRSRYTGNTNIILQVDILAILI